MSSGNWVVSNADLGIFDTVDQSFFPYQALILTSTMDFMITFILLFCSGVFIYLFPVEIHVE